MGGYREQVASLQSQLDFHRGALDRKTEEKLESDRVYQSARESALTLQAEVKEAQSLAERLRADLDRSQAEAAHLRAQCEKKDEKISDSTGMYLDLQRAVAEERAAFNRELAQLKQQLNLMEQEKIQAAAECTITANTLSLASKELDQLRASHAQTQAQLAAREEELAHTRYAAIELAVANKEKERRELKIEELQRELMATLAQLSAIQMEHSNCVKDFDEKLRCEHEANVVQKCHLEHQLSAATEDARRQADAVTTLESQIKELRHALVHAEKNAESAAELGRATAQTEILKRRVEELLAERRVHDSHSAGRIKELEEEVRAGEVLRRKMHNIIQELRGNVRVFARVRPFLPSDGVSADGQCSPVISLRDNSSLRILRAGSDNHRPEDHSFAFDKAFGQSASQVLRAGCVVLILIQRRL